MVLLASAAVAVTAVFGAFGCGKPQQLRAEYRAGDPVKTGALTYTVLESSWKSQLDAFPAPRVPDRNFLLIHVLVTNSGGTEVSAPSLKLENTSGDTFGESDNGAGVDQWLGLLRRLSPAQSADGWILFDVPTNAYKLRLSDGAFEGEKVAYVSIPLSIPDKP
ncbi:MAG: DUF4352 domain-containing protein [Acidobacteria bacterium]|nr:DUF4352 domain-containing protein [Acidobacteriota bacterium]